MDQESYQRFLQLTDEKLRQDILDNLIEQDGKFRFTNRKNGACAMLDSDGLCRIQRNTQEEMLCNTCRKFPRITAGVSRQGRKSDSPLHRETGEEKIPSIYSHQETEKGMMTVLSSSHQELGEEKTFDIYSPQKSEQDMMATLSSSHQKSEQNKTTETAGQEDVVWLSLAASCPVVAEYILDAAVSWLWLDESGQLHPLSRIQWEKIRTITAIPAKEEGATVFWNASALFDIFVDRALDVLDILVRFPEIPYLEQSFDLYDAEEPDLVVFGHFFTETESSWQTFVQQYQCYRYPSRYLEFQKESGVERTQQIQGELLLIRIMLCSRYVLRGSIERTDWLEILHWVYRFSAHGQVMAEQVHAIFSSIKMECLQIAYQNVCLK